MTADPQRDALYAAEDAALAGRVRRFRRWREVEAFVGEVLADDAWSALDPCAPDEVTLARRSRGATAALADCEERVVAVPDGCWDVLTVLHELAHLLSPGGEDHGPRFARTELHLVRCFVGFHEYVALRDAFARHGVAVAPDPPGSVFRP